jgi:hypothetical protein
MTIRASKTPMHWNYFLAIERDLEVVSRYVEFDKRNLECFSIEIAKILLSAAAEVDVVCQEICRAHGLRVGNINDHRKGIMKTFPTTPDFEVEIARYGFKTKPWDNWGAAKHPPPFWWTAYNKTKHARQAEYHRANLGNAINAVGGLFIVTLYLYQAEARLGLAPTPQLFTVDAAHFRGVSIGGIGTGAMTYNV